MKKILTMICGMLLTFISSMNAKTLVVYYSYTNNCHDIVQTLSSQIDTDVMRIEPADKTQKYEANGYAIGTKLLNAIKAAPNDAASYPAIDPVSITDLTPYHTIIIVTPLWWSQMAAIMQTYLFHHGGEMAGKNVGLIVSSASSGISGVVSDCKRLVPSASYFSESLWINNSNRSSRSTLIQHWLTAIDYHVVTAIKRPATKATDTAGYYSPSGQRLSQAPKRGIFIVNGKKRIR
ncbi:MAG: flavodoxin [Prevotella sp.]|nr:flavodoxin [Prevotella sp.]